MPLKESSNISSIQEVQEVEVKTKEPPFENSEEALKIEENISNQIIEFFKSRNKKNNLINEEEEKGEKNSQNNGENNGSQTTNTENKKNYYNIKPYVRKFQSNPIVLRKNKKD